MSRTDAHTPLWVRRLDPNFNEIEAFRRGLRTCSCYMCYGTEQVKHRRAVVRTAERQLLQELVKADRADLDMIETHVGDAQDKWVSIYRGKVTP